MPDRALKVLVRTPVNLYSGYGRDGIGICKSLVKWGCDVYLEPTYVAPPIPKEVAGLLTKHLKAPFDLLIQHGDPDNLGISKAAAECSEVKVAWSMWEFGDAKPLAKRVSSFSRRMSSFDLSLMYDTVAVEAWRQYAAKNHAWGVLQGGYESGEFKHFGDRDWFGDDFMFIMHGQLHSRKAPYVTIQAFNELKHEHPDSFAGAKLGLHTTIGDPLVLFGDLIPRVRVYHEMWEKETLEAFYHAAHVLVAPSRGEGKNLPALEMMTTGGAVAATNWGGHALALDTPLPTPNGWTTMGDVGVGSVILDEQSMPCVVTAKSAIHLRDCFRVTFSDSTSVVASDEHRWQVQDSPTSAWRVCTTRELYDRAQQGRQNVRVPNLAAFEGTERELLVNPYVLGLWLADGETSGSRITVGTADLEETRKQLARFGAVLSESYTKTELGEGWRLNLHQLKPQLREIGVLGAKHIPAMYLRASVEQRLELLRGLMDGDGWVSARGQCCFSNNDTRLLAGVQELLRSLGIRVTTGKVSGSRQYLASFWTDRRVFSLERKVQRHAEAGKASDRTVTRTVRRIEQVLTVPTQCLTVDSPSHLYLCGEGWIATHNTQWLGNDYAYPLDYTLGPTYPEIPGCPAFDAKVSVQTMKDFMWHAINNRGEVKMKAERAAQIIPAMCDWDVVMEKFFERCRMLIPGKGEQLYDKAMSCRREG